MYNETFHPAAVRPARQGLLQGRLLLRQPQRPAHDLRRDGLRGPGISTHHLQRLREPSCAMTPEKKILQKLTK